MKYLLYAGAGIGDWAVISIMAKAIHTADPEAYVKVFSSMSKRRYEINKELMPYLEFIDDVDYYSFREPLHSIGFVIQSGPGCFDYGIAFRYTVMQGGSVWPDRIIKFASKRTAGIRNPYSKIRHDIEIDFQKGVSKVELMKQMLGLMGIAFCDDAAKIIDCNKLKEDYPWKEIENHHYVSLCIGTGDVARKQNGRLLKNKIIVKQWPLKNWVALAGRLAEKGYIVLLLGGKKEAEQLQETEALSSGNGKQIIDLTGKLTLGGSLSAMLHSELIAGGDTGLMHCAAGMQKKTLTLFGPTDYREYLPYGENSDYLAGTADCSPCFNSNSMEAVYCVNNHCMKEITVEDVYDRLLNLL